MCSIIVVEQWGQNTSLFTWPLRKFPFKVCIEQIPLSCYHSIVQDRSLSLKAWASQYLLQSKPPEPGNVEDRDSCAASVFVLNLTSFSCMSCIKSRHDPSFSSLVFKKEWFIMLKYKYTSLSVQSIHRNWCCNIKTTEFTFSKRTCSVQLTCHTRVMFTVYFITCLMHKVKYKPKKVIG